MRVKNRKAACAFISILLHLLLPTKIAVCQSINGVIVRPMEIGLSIEPGSEFSGEIILTAGEAAQNLKVESFDIVLVDGKLTYKKMDRAGSYAASDWIRPEVSSLILAEGEVKKISYKVQVPEGVRAGSYKAIMSITDQGGAKGSSSVTILGRIGITFNINVLGVTKAKVTALGVAGEWYGRSLKFAVRIKNLGSLDMKPSGRLILTNNKSSDQSVQYSFKGESIKPGQEGLVRVEGGKLASGHHRALIKLDEQLGGSYETNFYVTSPLLAALILILLIGVLILTVKMIYLVIKRD